MTRNEELDLDRLARDQLHFRRRVVELATGEELRIDADPWWDAIVFLDSGEIELECVAGERRRFSTGAMLCLVPQVCMVRNCGAGPARLTAISRRRHTG